MDIYQIIWLVVFVIFLVVEIATLGLTTLWFAIGAIIAFLASFFDIKPYMQIIIFVASSVLLFIGFFPFVKKRLGAKTYNTNVDSLVGKEAVITEEITFNKVGSASVNGVIWSASSDEEIAKGDVVTIKEILGNKLIVEKKHSLN